MTSATERTPAARDPLYVDYSAFQEKHLTGIGRFMARLLEALARRHPVRLFHVAGGEDILFPMPASDGADADVHGWARRVLKGPRAAHDRGEAARCAGLYSTLRPLERHFGRELGILYDFTTLLLPWCHAPLTREHFDNYFGKSSVLCDQLVAISRGTRHDASWLCALPNDKVVVGYPGPSLCVHAHAHTGPVRRRDNEILVVSALEPRKNGPFLLDWFNETDALGPDMELWWVGPKAWWSSRAWLKGFARRGTGRRRVRFLGVVSDAELCRLYQEATFTIYPSLYEGFGFPVLDSLVHGAPVACSYNSSLKEFEGPGVFYFDPCDPASVDDACRELLAARPVAIDQAALRERFSWDALARTVLDLCSH